MMTGQGLLWKFDVRLENLTSGSPRRRCHEAYMDHTILQNSEQVRMGQELVTGLEASEARMKTNNEEIYCSVVCDVNGLFYFKTGKHD